MDHLERIAAGRLLNAALGNRVDLTTELRVAGVGVAFECDAVLVGADEQRVGIHAEERLVAEARAGDYRIGVLGRPVETVIGGVDAEQVPASSRVGALAHRHEGVGPAAGARDDRAEVCNVAQPGRVDLENGEEPAPWSYVE